MTTPTSGNFTLTSGANTTNAIAFNAPASEVQNALTTIIGNHSVVSVSGNAGGPYLVALRPNMVNIKKPHKKWVVEITRSINGKKVRYCKSFNSLAKAQKARDAYNKKHPIKKTSTTTSYAKRLYDRLKSNNLCIYCACELTNYKHVSCDECRTIRRIKYEARNRDRINTQGA